MTLIDFGGVIFDAVIGTATVATYVYTYILAPYADRRRYGDTKIQDTRYKYRNTNILYLLILPSKGFHNAQLEFTNGGYARQKI